MESRTSEYLKILENSFQDTSAIVRAIPSNDWNTILAGGWSVGDEANHMLRSITPIAQALRLPSLFFRLIGKPNRPPRSYDDLMERYKQKLKSLKSPPKRFDPKRNHFLNKDEWIKQWDRTSRRLIRQWKRWDEHLFEKHLAPHPLLGKIYMLELLYFCCYHNELHRKAIVAKKNWLLSEISEIKTPAEISHVCALARKIWNEHYPPIIGQNQVDYMLEKFHHPNYIANQIASENYRYHLLQTSNGQDIGYFAYQRNKSDYFISKLYITANYRSKGYGKLMLNFIKDQAKKEQIHLLWLTVNKYNLKSIEAYKKWGFEQTESLIIDIGNGYAMDDFKFSKRI